MHSSSQLTGLAATDASGQEALAVIRLADRREAQLHGSER
jgi:hypothetical protein